MAAWRRGRRTLGWFGTRSAPLRWGAACRLCAAVEAQAQIPINARKFKILPRIERSLIGVRRRSGIERQRIEQAAGNAGAQFSARRHIGRGWITLADPQRHRLTRRPLRADVQQPSQAFDQHGEAFFELAEGIGIARLCQIRSGGKAATQQGYERSKTARRRIAEAFLYRRLIDEAAFEAPGRLATDRPLLAGCLGFEPSFGVLVEPHRQQFRPFLPGALAPSPADSARHLSISAEVHHFAM
jgi:hypothetical protein